MHDHQRSAAPGGTGGTGRGEEIPGQRCRAVRDLNPLSGHIQPVNRALPTAVLPVPDRRRPPALLRARDLSERSGVIAGRLQVTLADAGGIGGRCDHVGFRPCRAGGPEPFQYPRLGVAVTNPPGRARHLGEQRAAGMRLRAQRRQLAAKLRVRQSVCIRRPIMPENGTRVCPADL